MRKWPLGSRLASGKSLYQVKRLTHEGSGKGDYSCDVELQTFLDDDPEAPSRVQLADLDFAPDLGDVASEFV